jgi:hypothetical protein
MWFLPMFAQWVLSFFQNGEKRLQIIVVLFIFPLVMNIVQAWLTDVIIKNKMRVRLPLQDASDQESVRSEVSFEALVQDDSVSWTDFVRGLFRSTKYSPVRSAASGDSPS